MSSDVVIQGIDGSQLWVIDGRCRQRRIGATAMTPLGAAKTELVRAELHYQIECARLHVSYPTKLYRAQARLYAAREKLARLMGGE